MAGSFSAREKALRLIPAPQKQKQKLGVAAHAFQDCSQEAGVGKLLNLRLAWTTQLDPGELVL